MVHIYSDGYLIGAKFSNHLSDNFRFTKGGTTCGYLISASFYYRCRRSNITNTTSNCKRNRCRFSNPPNNIKHSGPILDSSGYVKKSKLVGSGLTIGLCAFDGVASITNIHKMNAFNYTTILHIQTRHNANLFIHS